MNSSTTRNKRAWAHFPALMFMALSLIGLGAQALSAGKSQPSPDQITFFESKIRPVLLTSCAPCHGKTTRLGGLRLDTKDGFQKGGDSGGLIVDGDPDKSLLITAIRQTGPLKMPQGGKLTPAQVSDFTSWVKMGAPWPTEAEAKADSKADLWSLRPVMKPNAPAVIDKAWVRNPIDAFVLARLEGNKINPSPPADRRTLLRRITYDLTGLPPTPDEAEAFLADKSSTAYEKVVDRLLKSPHYGERWARHWLDVARYADTKGYVFEEDRNYPNAYTYRDWVISAINADLPYDQFVTQQIAADLLPEVQNGEDKRPLAGLGFLTVGRRFLNQTPDIIDDRIDVTMRGFEGFTVGCARCHDHKFDPIPTQDYYSLYAVFNSSREKLAPISERAIRDPWERHDNQVTETEQAITKVIADQVKKLRKENATPEGAGSLSAEVKQVLQAIREETLPSGKNLTILSKAFEPSQQEQLSALQGKLAELKKTMPPAPEFAMAMEDAPNASDGVVFKRGNPGTPGPPAPRRFLAALSKPGEERPHWTQGSGRLELARSIVSRDNPLTARVFVNRVWQHHFGAGIVRTPSDFGHQGELPTDPKLLDYLAATFMESGWSMKKLHRLIVTSSTYRQSSTVSQATFNKDPDNRLWSRMNRQRLDLEEMRDSLMFAAKRLDLSKVGGKSVDLWQQPFSDRRAVYGFIERQNLPGIFRTFDFATPDATSPKRFVTTVPQQALFFLNSPFAMDAAREIASRPEIKSSKDAAQAVRRLYLLLFDRLPDAQETASALSYLGSTASATVETPRGPWRYGYGGFDSAAGKAPAFSEFSTYDKPGYTPGKSFPDPLFGYLVLNAAGGHPGRDASHAAVRRWMAPFATTVQVAGTVAHRQAQGDGVRARIVSSRGGLLGEYKVHNAEARTDVTSISVQKGDTLDFIVDPQENDSFDAFSWAPTIRTLDGKHSWKASSDFGPPPPPGVSRLTLYAQALLMSNEFMFVD